MAIGLNEPAPDFTATSTHGEIKLSDFEGKWIVLFSHPADFTPVCTTEMVEFARLQEAFRQRDTQLIGLSVDSIYAHIAWIRNIEEKFGVPIQFPIIADMDTKVAQLYGMIHPGAESTATVRCVFFIDPKRVVRSMIYYPLTNGRNTDEVLRILEALQMHDAHNVATPANWRPGDPVIAKPPLTQEAAEKRVAEARESAALDQKDWYFTRKNLPESVGKVR